MLAPDALRLAVPLPPLTDAVPNLLAALAATEMSIDLTNDLLSGSPQTSMVGNLINETVLTPGQTGYAGAFVMLVLIASLLPMLYYVRSVSRADRVAT